jgi:hypothetical protein
MAKDLESEIEKGRAVKDTIEMEGWKLIEAKIKEEIEDERRALMEIEPKTFPDLAMEFIGRQKTMKGLERVLEIINEFLAAKENAENKLRSEKSE